MNHGGKNFLIVLLSVIVLLQSAFLGFLLSRPRAPAPRPGTAAPPAPRVQPRALPGERKGMREAPPLLGEKPSPPSRPRAVVGKIAIVLDDWGYNLKHRDFITDNHFRVTLSILPFRDYSTEIAELAFVNNKDIMIHMPMEPNHKDHYGLEEKTLLVGMDRKTVVRLLEEARVSVPHAAGVNNHMGSKATADARLMSVVLEYLKKNNLFFLDSFVTPHSVCAALAEEFGVDFARRDIFIDNENDPAYIRNQLLKLAAAAKASGLAVGIGHDRPATIAVLKEVIPQLEQEGYFFCGVAEAVRRKNGQGHS